MIELKHLEKTFAGGSTVLRDVNAVINDGDVISVIGPSGTGKSTLLRCINLLEKPTGGRILFDGEDITAPGYDPTRARRRMGRRSPEPLSHDTSVRDTRPDHTTDEIYGR